MINFCHLVFLSRFKVVESEKTAKWQYTKHCEDLTIEIKKLREEVPRFHVKY